MKVLTVFAHPNRKSFCHAVLDQFTKGLQDAGHTSEVVDLYASGSIRSFARMILPAMFTRACLRISSTR